jgi:L-arabinose isomerase
MSPIRIGLLPLYIKLYDDVDPALRVKQMPFLRDVARALEAEGLELVVSDVCRVRAEFEQAVQTYNEQGVAAVVTLHLAYSPSLEAIDALAALDMPIILMDTTPVYDFIAEAGVQAIDRNHGIHGVQDLCSVLKRRGVPYHLACGHLEHSGIAGRVAGLCRAAAAAKALRGMRVGLVGEPFDGMGDFRVDPDNLRQVTGAQVLRLTPEEAFALSDDISEADIDAQVSEDMAEFDVELEHPENHRPAARAALTLRRWMEQNALGAASVNFEKVSQASGLLKMPFVELSRMMSRGIGYAGEGDVLTAALTGALMSAYPETSFVEMFCPDWKRGVLLLSHMAEMNCALSGTKPLLTDVPFPYTDAGDTVGVFGCLRSGGAVLVNLAPLRLDRYTLLLAEVEMLRPDWDETGLRNQIRGWMKPRMPLERFLAWFSEAGGTHHSALVYGADVRSVSTFGRMMGFEVVIAEK